VSLELSHQQIEEMLGAFAVDAVDAPESEIIELHLRTCPRCRAEVAEHREVAALLAHSGAQAPDGIWSRILAEIEPAPPALRMPEMRQPVGLDPEHSQSLGPEAAPADIPSSGGQPSLTDHGDVDASVIDLSSRSSTLRRRTLTAVVAAAAVIIAILGVVTVRQSQHLNRLDQSLRDVSVDRVATRAMSDPHAATGKLVSGDGRVEVPVVLAAQGKGYLFATRLPELPRNRTYQLWGQARGATVSLGVFDGATDVVPFQVGNDLRDHLSRLLITRENSPGVLITKQQPILVGAV
jgi:anti-sigma factor RsiW